MPCRFLPLPLCVDLPLPGLLCVFREDEISWSLRGTEVARVPTGMVGVVWRKHQERYHEVRIRQLTRNRTVWNVLRGQTMDCTCSHTNYAGARWEMLARCAPSSRHDLCNRQFSLAFLPTHPLFGSCHAAIRALQITRFTHWPLNSITCYVTPSPTSRQTGIPQLCIQLSSVYWS